MTMAMIRLQQDKKPILQTDTPNTIYHIVVCQLCEMDGSLLQRTTGNALAVSVYLAPCGDRGEKSNN